MKRLLWMLPGFGSAIVLAQGPLVLHRTYAVGDKVSYDMAMTEHLETSDADVHASWTETVTALDKNGLASEQLEYTNFHILANGNDIPARAPEPKPIGWLSSWGYTGSLTEEGSVSHLLPDLFASYALGLSLSPGQDTTIAANADTDHKVTGTARLYEVTGGRAKVGLKLQLSNKAEPQPMLVTGTAVFDVADGSLVSFEGTASDLPTKMAGRYNVQAADFKVHRAGHTS